MHADDVALPKTTAEILRIDGGRDGVDVAPCACVADGEKERPPSGGRDGMIEAVVGVGGNDLAGPDAGEGVGPADSLEVDELEILAGGICQSTDIRNVVAVGQADARKAAPEEIRREDRGAVTIRNVVQQVTLTWLVEQRN